MQTSPDEPGSVFPPGPPQTPTEWDHCVKMMVIAWNDRVYTMKEVVRELELEHVEWDPPIDDSHVWKPSVW